MEFEDFGLAIVWTIFGALLGATFGATLGEMIFWAIIFGLMIFWAKTFGTMIFGVTMFGVMTFGLIISAVCKTKQDAIQIGKKIYKGPSINDVIHFGESGSAKR